MENKTVECDAQVSETLRVIGAPKHLKKNMSSY